MNSWRKMINTLAGTSQLAHHSLHKLKKYESLISNDKHEVTEINQITDTPTDMDGVITLNPKAEMYSTRPIKIILIGVLLEL